MEVKESNPFAGRWRIYEMELWDEDYFDMEVPAYIEINENDTGDFQFGLVSGHIDGESVNGDSLEFTWSGNDECDEAFGSGRLKLKDKDTLKGKIKFHQGDKSKFRAKRI